MSKRRQKPGDFELRHWRSPKRRQPNRPSSLHIPNGYRNHNHEEHEDEEEGCYISLRDILASPEYADAASPVRAGAGGCSWPEINITNPLVKHAAYAYLQPAPSARDISTPRGLRIKRLLSHIFSPCLEFLGVIFNFRR